MPTFDASTVEALTFDFTKYVPDAKGEIPEPSSDQMDRFIELLRQLMPIKTTEDGRHILDVEAVAERFKDNTDEAEALLNQGISDLCSGAMTPDQIEANPYRVKQAFYGWVVGTFLSPEA